MPTLVIIGGGPAGLSAAIYAVRAGLDVQVLYKDDGALGKTDKIENYFGFPDVLSGAELLSRGRAQAERLGAQLHRTPTPALPSRRPAASATRMRCCSRPARRVPCPILQASANSRDAA